MRNSLENDQNQSASGEALAQASDLVRASASAGLRVRIAGSVAVYYHSPTYANLLIERGRKIADIDLVTLRDDARELRNLLNSRGYKADRAIEFAAEGMRSLFMAPAGQLPVDVFVDGLNFCQYIDLRGRLECDYPTISLADLWLSKMQIHTMAERDLLDTAILMIEHELCLSEVPECIDAGYIRKILSKDWGFYHAVELNCDRLVYYLRTKSPLPSALLTCCEKRLLQLLETVRSAPKSLGWKARSIWGEHVNWYKEVDTRNSVF